eukprot:GILK01002749.1.p1 GENE.GILK01002749.1~~GILK01002749.1.p1  ORF type:complete len:764 (-),score=122.74 GILK01002749.1:190-2481(-)
MYGSEFPSENGDFGPSLNGPDELAIDESLSLIDRIKSFAFSKIGLQRLVNARNFANSAKDVGLEDTITHLLPLLETMAEDPDAPMRQALVEQFFELATFLSNGGDAAYRKFIDTILPLVAKLISDKSQEVSASAGHALVELSALIHPEDRGAHLLTIVLSLAHDDESEEHRMIAVQLLNEMAKHLGKDLCQQFVALELISLAEDPLFRVRKAAAGNFANVCKTVGQEYCIQRLLPVFIHLSQDGIWGVRKACAESLVGVAESVSQEVRHEKLVDVLENLLKDASRWVRVATFQQIGPFLSLLRPDQITDSLLLHYTSMANPSFSPNPSENEIAIFCAYSFPAVVLTLGPERWHEISATFQTLVKDMQWKVRKTLSHSLHEIAKILGPTIMDNELLPTLDLFLKDLDEVKMGAVQHLAELLEIVQPSKREAYLPIFNEIQSDQENWRLRSYLSRQLRGFARLFSPAATYSVITPLTMKLCRDPVAQVREVAIQGLGALVERLGEIDSSWQAEIIRTIQSLATAHTFKDRQLFVAMCEYLMDDVGQATFEREFLPHLKQLSRDHVPNVRLSVSRMLAKHFEKNGAYTSHAEVQAVASCLRDDEDYDVRCYLLPEAERVLDIRRYITQRQQKLQRLQERGQNMVQYRVPEPLSVHEEEESSPSVISPTRKPTGFPDVNRLAALTNLYLNGDMNDHSDSGLPGLSGDDDEEVAAENMDKMDEADDLRVTTIEDTFDQTPVEDVDEAPSINDDTYSAPEEAMESLSIE